MKTCGIVLSLLAVSILSASANAFDGHGVTEGPLVLFIEEIPKVTMYDEPIGVRLRVQNTGDEELRGLLLIRDLVDERTSAGTLTCWANSLSNPKTTR